VEKIVIGTKQTYVVFGSAAADAVAIPQIQSRLAVQAEISNFLITSQE
jgi:hypothetical protein